MDDEKVPTIPSEPCWIESIQAVKDSTRFQAYEEFRTHLIRTLPQNSLATRKRYSSYILKRFFPNGSLRQLPAAVWHAYQEETLLEQVMRYSFLSHEPLIGGFVGDVLFQLRPGSQIPRALLEDYIFRIYGETKEKVVARLVGSLRALGFIARRMNKWIVQGTDSPDLALVILTHELFARTPKVVTLKQILSNSYWKYVGLRDEGSVRGILRVAAAKEMIAKYVVADDVEQITTRYSLEELLERRMRL